MSEDIERIRTISDRVADKLRRAEPRPEVAEAEARARREQQRRVAMEEIGVPPRFQDATFEAARALPAIVRAREFAEADVHLGRCLLLSGPTGVGKTHAACCILAALPERHRRFFYFGDLAARLLDGGRERHETLELVQRIPLLVLDDLGVEYAKAGGLLEAFLDSVFWHRESHFRPTVITSNLTPEDLKARLSRRIVDRLRGDWGEVFTVTGPSLRGKA